MGLASAIIWIIIGIVYIIYKSIKDEPDKATPWLLACLTYIGGYCLFVWIFKSLMKTNMVLAIIFMLIGFYVLIRLNIKWTEDDRREREELARKAKEVIHRQHADSEEKSQTKP